MADVKYMVTVDATGAVKEIQTLDAAWDKVKKTAPETTGVMGQLGNALKSVAGQFTIATLAAKAIEGTIAGVKNFFKSSIEGAMADEASQFRLRTALEMTGRARQGGVKDLEDFAQSQAKATLYTDEEIRSTMTLLAQLTDLDTEGIKKATKGIIGLAAVLGPDEGGLGGATMRVTRAIEGNATGLKRVGIEIDTTLPKGQQLIQLQERLAELYPRATAELETTLGSVKQAAKEWDEFKEKIGGVIRESLPIKEMAGMTVDALRGEEEQTVKTARSFRDLAIANAQYMSKGGFGVIYRDYAIAQNANEDLIETQKIFDDFIGDIVAKGKEGGVNMAALNNALKDLGIKGAGEVATKLELAKNTLSDYLKTSDPAPGIVDALNKKIEELTLALKGPKDPIDLIRNGIHSLKVDMKDSEAQFKEWKDQWLDSLVAADDLPVIDWDAVFKEQFPQTIEVPPFLTGLITEMDKVSHEAQILSGKTRASFESISKTSLNSELVALKTKFDDMKKSGDYSADELDRVAKSIKRVENELKDTPKWVVSFRNAIEDLAPVAEAVFSGLGTIFDQAQKNKEISIENEYKKRLNVINQTVKDEEEKQKAIVALEAEFEIKRTEARRAGAKQQKAVAIAEAIWNTARAVTEVLPNFILAAIVGAFGAAQIGLIAKQPIPLARGAVFNKPTRMTDEVGTTYEMGEAGPEYLIPEKHLAPLLGGRRGPTGLIPQFAGMSRATTININSPLIQGHGYSEADLERAGDKLLRIVERKMRLRGRG